MFSGWAYVTFVIKRKTNKHYMYTIYLPNLKVLLSDFFSHGQHFKKQPQTFETDNNNFEKQIRSFGNFEKLKTL